MQFDPPARYFPIQRGVYEVTPGLKPLGTDFGNGGADGRVFQIDSDFERYRQNKILCRNEGLGKYFVTADFSSDVENAVMGWFVDRLATEYPAIFEIQMMGGHRQLTCRHTGDQLLLDSESRLVESSPVYTNAFDALANQVQEDLCVIRMDDQHDWLAAAHLCSPGHWAAEDKIGRDFVTAHQPVPGIEPIARHARAFVQAMIRQPPMVRFVWGFGTDNRLNHHPIPPNGVEPSHWRGRIFDPQNPRFYLRVERQVIWGLPAVNAAIFTIRVSHLDGHEIRENPIERGQLVSALRSMSPEARRYKGLECTLDAVLEWLGHDARS